MQAGERDAKQAQRDHVLDLISAVAAGDAAREDVVSALRNEGVDSLDILIEILARATRKGPGIRSRSRPLDVQRLSNNAATDRTSQIVHQVPQLPFLLRGTLYDPVDIDRFNGKELHFLSARNRDQLVVIDDRAVMENWWQLTSISLNLSSVPHALSTNELAGGGNVTPTNIGDPTVIVGKPGGSSGPEGFGPPIPAPPPPQPHTNFYEDINYGGSRLILEPNRGYADLTEVAYTFFGTGDWNDTISSIELVATGVAVLYEDVDWMGSTFTTTQNEPNLLSYGWNDRASAIGTW
jgi:hypothetical protein